MVQKTKTRLRADEITRTQPPTPKVRSKNASNIHLSQPLKMLKIAKRKPQIPSTANPRWSTNYITTAPLWPPLSSLSFSSFPARHCIFSSSSERRHGTSRHSSLAASVSNQSSTQNSLLTSSLPVETVGYVGRAVSAHQTPDWTLVPYVCQSLLLLLGPTLYAASIYMVLGRIVRLTKGESHSIINPGRLTKLFVLGDVISFLAQSGGRHSLSGVEKVFMTAANH